MFSRYRLTRSGFWIAVGAFAILVGLFIGIVILAGSPVGRIEVDDEFYFLVRECRASTSAAVVGEVYAAGGAGYPDGDTVVLACYYSKADARRICSLMEDRGENVSVLDRAVPDITLRGDMAEAADRVLANYKTVDSCARLLFDAANGLERGSLTQKEAKAALGGVADSLKGLRTGNAGDGFSAWNRELYRLEREGRDRLDGILFAKDLRYLQVSLCYALLGMGSCF